MVAFVHCVGVIRGTDGVNEKGSTPQTDRQTDRQIKSPIGLLGLCLFAMSRTDALSRTHREPKVSSLFVVLCTSDVSYIYFCFTTTKFGESTGRAVERERDPGQGTGSD